MKRTSRAAVLALIMLAGLFTVAGSRTDAAPPFGPWSIPENLGAVVNSTVTDIAPALSKDGRSLYFASSRAGGFGGQDVWVSQREGSEAPWGAPVNVGPMINTPFNDQGAVFSRDMHWLFFVSDRPDGRGGQDVWRAWRADVHDDFGWNAPINLGDSINGPVNDHGPGFWEGNATGGPFLYFASSRPGLGGDDIYASTLGPDGTWGPATLLVELSSPFTDLGPEIRYDGLELILHSDRPDALGGADLYASRRESTRDPWSPPVNLGPDVNTVRAEQAAALSRDGRSMIFLSNRPGGFGGSDLYITTREKLRAR